MADTNHCMLFSLFTIVLYAGFQQSLYTFSESVGRASLTVTVSGSIAKTLQLRVRGGTTVENKLVSW